jgi:hypothetical protein
MTVMTSGNSLKFSIINNSNTDFSLTSNGILPNSQINQTGAYWSYFSASYSTLLNQSDNCDANIQDSFSCMTSTISSTVIPSLNLSNNDLVIKMDNTLFPSCSGFYMKNFRFFSTFKYGNEFGILRFRKLNGFYYDYLMWNFYFEEGSSTTGGTNYVFNNVRRNKISSTLSENFYDDGYNAVSLTSTTPEFVNLDELQELTLCNDEQVKTFSNEACHYINYDDTTIATAINSQLFTINKSSINFELLVEVWVQPLDVSTSQTIWTLNINNSQFLLSNSFTSTSLILDMSPSAAQSQPQFTQTSALTGSQVIPANKWTYFIAGISATNCQGLLFSSTITNPFTFSFANCSYLPSTTSNIKFILTKNLNGFIRNFRIWEDYSNYSTYINNKFNTPNNLFYVSSNKYSNRLLANLPLNHPGQNLIDLVNSIYNNNQINKITSEYSDNITTGSSFSGYKMTRYVSRDRSDSSTNKLVICEGETIYDSTTNSCYPQNLTQALSIQSNSKEIYVPSSSLNNLGRSWFFSFWFYPVSNSIPYSIFTQPASACTSGTSNFYININYISGVSYITLGNGVTPAITFTPNFAIYGWTHVGLVSNDSNSVSVYLNFNQFQATYTLSTLMSKNCHLYLGQPTVATYGTDLFLMRELKIGFYPFNPNYFNLIANHSQTHYDTLISLYFPMVSIVNTNQLPETVSKSNIQFTTNSTPKFKLVNIVDYTDTTQTYDGIVCANFSVYMYFSGKYICTPYNSLSVLSSASTNYSHTVTTIPSGIFTLTFQVKINLNLPCNLVGYPSNINVLTYSAISCYINGTSFICKYTDSSKTITTNVTGITGYTWLSVAIRVSLDYDNQNLLTLVVNGNKSSSSKFIWNPPSGTANAISLNPSNSSGTVLNPPLYMDFTYVKLFSHPKSDGWIMSMSNNINLSQNFQSLIFYMDFRAFITPTDFYDTISNNVSNPMVSTNLSQASGSIKQGVSIVCPGKYVYNSSLGTCIYKQNPYLQNSSSSALSIPFSQSVSTSEICFEIWFLFGSVNSMTGSGVIISTNNNSSSGSFSISINSNKTLSFSVGSLTIVTSTLTVTENTWVYISFSVYLNPYQNYFVYMYRASDNLSETLISTALSQSYYFSASSSNLLNISIPNTTTGLSDLYLQNLRLWLGNRMPVQIVRNMFRIISGYYHHLIFNFPFNDPSTTHYNLIRPDPNNSNFLTSMNSLSSIIYSGLGSPSSILDLCESNQNKMSATETCSYINHRDYLLSTALSPTTFTFNSAEKRRLSDSITIEGWAMFTNLSAGGNIEIIRVTWSSNLGFFVTFSSTSITLQHYYGSSTNTILTYLNSNSENIWIYFNAGVNLTVRSSFLTINNQTPLYNTNYWSPVNIVEGDAEVKIGNDSIVYMRNIKVYRGYKDPSLLSSQQFTDFTYYLNYVNGFSSSTSIVPDLILYLPLDEVSGNKIYNHINYVNSSPVSNVYSLTEVIPNYSNTPNSFSSIGGVTTNGLLRNYIKSISYLNKTLLFCRDGSSFNTSTLACEPVTSQKGSIIYYSSEKIKVNTANLSEYNFRGSWYLKMWIFQLYQPTAGQIVNVIQHLCTPSGFKLYFTNSGGINKIGTQSSFEYAFTSGKWVHVTYVNSMTSTGPVGIFYFDGSKQTPTDTVSYYMHTSTGCDIVLGYDSSAVLPTYTPIYMLTSLAISSSELDQNNYGYTYVSQSFLREKGFLIYLNFMNYSLVNGSDHTVLDGNGSSQVILASSSNKIISYGNIYSDFTSPQTFPVECKQNELSYRINGYYTVCAKQFGLTPSINTNLVTSAFALMKDYTVELYVKLEYMDWTVTSNQEINLISFQGLTLTNGYTSKNNFYVYVNSSSPRNDLSVTYNLTSPIFSSWFHLAYSVHYSTGSSMYLELEVNGLRNTKELKYIPSVSGITLRSDSLTGVKVTYGYIRIWKSPISISSLRTYKGATLFDRPENMLLTYWDFRYNINSVQSNQVIFYDSMLKGSNPIAGSTLFTATNTLIDNSYNFFCGGFSTLSTSNYPICKKKKIVQFSSVASSTPITLKPPYFPTMNSSSLLTADTKLPSYTWSFWIMLQNISPSDITKGVMLINNSVFNFSILNTSLQYQVGINNMFTSPPNLSQGVFYYVSVSYSYELKQYTLVFEDADTNSSPITVSNLVNDFSISLSSNTNVGLMQNSLLLNSNYANMSMMNLRLWSEYKSGNEMKLYKFTKLDGTLNRELIYNISFEEYSGMTSINNSIATNYDYLDSWTKDDNLYSISNSNSFADVNTLNMCDNNISAKFRNNEICNAKFIDNYMMAIQPKNLQFTITKSINLEFLITAWVQPITFDSNDQIICELATSSPSNFYQGTLRGDGTIAAVLTFKSVYPTTSANHDGTLTISNPDFTTTRQWLFVAFAYNPYIFQKILIADIKYTTQSYPPNSVPPDNSGYSSGYKMTLGKSFVGYIKSFRMYNKYPYHPSTVIKNRYDGPLIALRTINSSLDFYLILNIPLSEGSSLNLLDTSHDYSSTISGYSTSYASSSASGEIIREFASRTQFNSNNLLLLCDSGNLVYNSSSNSCMRTTSNSINAIRFTSSNKNVFLKMKQTTSDISYLPTFNHIFLKFWIRRLHSEFGLLTNSNIFSSDSCSTVESKPFTIYESFSNNKINIKTLVSGISTNILSIDWARNTNWSQVWLINSNGSTYLYLYSYGTVKSASTTNNSDNLFIPIDCNLYFPYTDDSNTTKLLYAIKDFAIGNYPFDLNTLSFLAYAETVERNAGFIYYFKLDSLYNNNQIKDEVTGRLFTITNDTSQSYIALIQANDMRFKDVQLENECPEFSRPIFSASNSYNSVNCRFFSGLNVLNSASGTTLSTSVISGFETNFQEFTFEVYFKLLYSTSASTSFQIASISSFNIFESAGKVFISYSGITQGIGFAIYGYRWCHLAFMIYQNKVSSRTLVLYVDNEYTSYSITGTFSDFNTIYLNKGTTAATIAYKYTRLWSNNLSYGEVVYYRNKVDLSQASNKLIAYYDFRVFYNSNTNNFYNSINPSQVLSASGSVSILSEEIPICAGYSVQSDNSSSGQGYPCNTKKPLYFKNSSAVLTLSPPTDTLNFQLNSFTIEMWMYLNIDTMTSSDTSSILKN